MPSEEPLPCPVCGASNVRSAETCGSCGVLLTKTDRVDDADALLEDLLSTPSVPEAVPAQADASLDVEGEVVDELLDSLRVDSPGKGLRIECPICGTELAAEATRCDHCGTEFKDVVLETPAATARAAGPTSHAVALEAPLKVTTARVPSTDVPIPVGVSPTETEPKVSFVSARMIDLVVGGTAAALVTVFIGFRLYAWSILLADPLPFGLFLGIAVGGMVAGFVVFRLSTSYLAQGDRLVKAGRYAEALPYFDRAIRMGHRPSNAYTSRGVALKRLGRYEDALRAQKTAVRLDPENEIAWCNLGDLHFRSGDFEKALESYDKALAIRPRYAIAWNNKGAALARMNRFEEARECHDRAVKLQPKYVVAWLNRGEVLTRLGDREEAQRCLDQARALGA
jgi:regulator of sirC expression with transglutaminase-like and TPR domain